MWSYYQAMMKFKRLLCIYCITFSHHFLSSNSFFKTKDFLSLWLWHRSFNRKCHTVRRTIKLQRDIIKIVTEQIRRCVITFLHYVSLCLLSLQTELRNNGNYQLHEYYLTWFFSITIVTEDCTIHRWINELSTVLWQNFKSDCLDR